MFPCVIHRRLSWVINTYSTTERNPVVSLDVMDISGELQRDISHNVLKVRLDHQGVMVPNSYSAELRNDLDKMNDAKKEGYCGSCYGGMEPESGCCNTCEEVRTAYVNRGWSFANPDAIEQVRYLTVFPITSTVLISPALIVQRRRVGR